jgi:hypothetical protein
MAAILSPLSLYGGSRKTKLLLLHNTRIHTPEGHFGNSRCSTIRRMLDDRTSLSLDASLVIPTRVLRFEVSRRARLLSAPAEPPVLVLWLNQVTRRFCGEPPQTPRADSGREPLPCTGSYPRLRLAFLATMRPTLDPVRPPSPSSRAYFSPLLGGPAQLRPFTLTLHLHLRKSNRNLHLPYSAKSQSTPRCQSLITPGSDHPLVLGCSGSQSPP